MNRKDLVALLFVATEPMSIKEITHLLQEEDSKITESDIQRWIFELQYLFEDTGLIIRQVDGSFELLTDPKCHSIVQKVVPKKVEQLSRSAIETLSIVAYTQPASRSSIAKKRNVKNPDHGIDLLLQQKLIAETESGFVTTSEFLRYMKINDIHELPELSTVNVETT